MSCIIESQPLKLQTTITDDGAVLTAPLTSAFYDYWIPGNYSSTATGTWNATILDAAAGTIEYDIPVDTLTGGVWKIQARAISGGLTFPACMDTVTVTYSGS